MTPRLYIRSIRGSTFAMTLVQCDGWLRCLSNCFCFWGVSMVHGLDYLFPFSYHNIILRVMTTYSSALRGHKASLLDNS
jgi:hypothetical protein